MKDSQMARLCSGVALVALSWPMGALAQSAQDKSKEPQQLTEVVVTATRVETVAQKTPVAINVYSGDTLQRADVHSVLTLQQIDPSIVINTNAGGVAVAIRGVTNTNLTEIGNATVAVAQDGFFTNRSYDPSSSFYDVARVEVLKGPQGTLFGRDSEGGLINTISQQPTHNFGGYVTAEGGNYALAGIEGAINVPLMGDQLAFRLSGFDRQHNGYVHATGSNGTDYYAGSERDSGARFQLKWTPVDYFSALLVYQIARDLSVPDVAVSAPQGVPLGQVNPWFITTAQAGTNQDNQSNRTRWEIDYSKLPFGATLTYTGGVGNVDWAFAHDNSSPTVASQFVQKELRQTWNHEVRIATPQDLPVTFQGGGYYFWEESNPLDSFQQEDSGPYIGQKLIDFKYNVKTMSRAGFFQAGWEVIHNVKLTAGGRYTWDNVERTGTAVLRCDVAGVPAFLYGALSCVGSPPAQTTPSFGNAETQVATYHVGAEWQATPNNLLYAKYDTGFKPGGINPQTPPAKPVPYAPERMGAFEVGSKNRFFDNRLMFNLDIFLQQYTNYQATVPVSILVPGAGNGAVYTNVGAAHINGAEIQAQWQATPTTRFEANATILDAHFGKQPILVLNPTGNATVNVSGNALPAAPPFTATAALNQDFPTNFGRFSFHIDGKYTSKYYFDLYNTNIISTPPTATGNMAIDFVPEKGSWRASVFINNFTNAIVLARAATNTTTLLNTYEYAPPLTYGVHLTYKF